MHRKVLDILIAENKKPLNGSEWSTAKLSTLLKNPIYVKADYDIYNYYDRHNVHMISDVSMFDGKHGAQLYGRSKHNVNNQDWSDMKLVLLTHEGIVDSDIWLKCQRKLEKNKQIGNSISNRTSWLSGKVICEKCGHTMTTIKSKVGKNGEIRRYFNCTGKSHKKICTGTKVTIYAQDLENMVYDCICEKLSDLKQTNHNIVKGNTAEVNDLKLKIKAIEKSEKQALGEGEKVISSESVGSWSVSYDTPTKADVNTSEYTTEKNKRLYSIVKEHLAFTGLLYRGVS